MSWVLRRDAARAALVARALLACVIVAGAARTQAPVAHSSLLLAHSNATAELNSRQPSAAKDLQDQLEVAHRAYASGDFERAFGIYEALAGDNASAQFLYNLGNCAFRLERYAEASLYYRRALARGLGGGDRERGEFNLALTLRQLGIPPEPSKNFGESTLARLASLDASSLAYLAALLQGLGILAWLRTRDRRLRAAAAAGLVLGLSCALRAASLTLAPPAAHAVVLAKSVEVHVEPHADETTSGELQAGEVVEIAELSDRWARVINANAAGWTPRSTLGLID